MPTILDLTPFSYLLDDNIQRETFVHKEEAAAFDEWSLIKARCRQRKNYPFFSHSTTISFV